VNGGGGTRTRVGLATMATVAAALAAVLPPTTARAATALADTTGQSVGYQIDATHDGHLAVGGPSPPLAKRWSRSLGGPSSTR
jgi:hypothetical protein